MINRFIYYSLIFILALPCVLLAAEKPVHIKNISLTEDSADHTYKINISIDPSWHINSHTPLDSYLIPTELKIIEPSNVTVSDIRYPEPVFKDLKISNDKLSLFEGDFIITVTTPKNQPVHTLALTYQACNNTTCLAPDTLTFSSKNNFDISRYYQSRMIVFFLLLFVAGLMLNLTPCVYPVIPLTIAYFLNAGQGNARNVFRHAIMYFFGMVLVYSCLGFVAATTGVVFGLWLENPLVIIFVALVFFVMALSMFGLFTIPVPSFRFLHKVGGGLLGALVAGVTASIVASPCVGPILLSLLVFVSSLHNSFMGFLIFFVLSLGFALPYLILGLFSQKLSKLPKSGRWLQFVKFSFGLILLGFSLFLIIYQYQPNTSTTFKNDIVLSKPITMIYFSSKWCIPCKEMDLLTFSDPTIKQALNEFDPVKIDATRGDDVKIKSLLMKYHVKGFPTILFVDDHGNVIQSISGYVDKKTLLHTLAELRK